MINSKTVRNLEKFIFNNNLDHLILNQSFHNFSENSTRQFKEQNETMTEFISNSVYQHQILQEQNKNLTKQIKNERLINTKQQIEIAILQGQKQDHENRLKNLETGLIDRFIKWLS